MRGTGSKKVRRLFTCEQLEARTVPSGTPTIGAFTLSATSVTPGTPITLTASNVAESGGTIASVNFYRESNGTPGLQIGSDTLLSKGTQSGTTWTLAISTAGLSGTVTYYAVATDSSSISSAVSSATINVENGSTGKIRIATYNIEDDINGATTPLPGLYQDLEGIGEEAIQGLPGGVVPPPNAQPIDVLGLEETTSNSVTIAPIVTNLNSYYNGIAVYAQSPYQGTQDGGDTDGNGPNGMVYNTLTLKLLASVGVGTPEGATNGEYRQVVRYEFQPVGDSGTKGTFFVYVAHSKSGTGTTNANDRNEEAQIIRNDEATLPANASVIYMGDLNLGTSSDPSYETLEAPTSPSGVAQGEGYDPLNMPGAWTLSSFVSIMTESDTDLRYRDDIEMPTQNVMNDTTGELGYIAGSFHTFADNGTTAWKGSVNSGSDTALNSDLVLDGSSMLSASTIYADLTTGSDHLPVVADYTVPVPLAPTITTLTASANSPVYGQVVTLTATLSDYYNPTGLVTFSDGGTTLGTASISGTTATFTTSFFSVGAQALTATYGGDSNNASSIGSLNLTVNQAASSISLASSGSSISYGQILTLTATVSASSPGRGGPTGTVTFLDGTTSLGTAPITAGTATYTTTALAVGSHSLTASYSGDTNFTAAASSALSQTVGQASSAISLQSTPNPVNFGATATFTASVSAVAPGAGTPTGTITFYDGSAPLMTVSMSAGAAVFITTTLAVGNHSITAVYSGDGNFLSGTSPVVTQVVNSTTPAPGVSGVVINGGQQQRSMLTSLTVTFSEVVNTAPLANAFTLTRLSDSATVQVNVSTAVVNNQTVATLTFSGSNTEGSDGLYPNLSIADGNWTLTINHADVVSGGTIMATDYTQANIKRIFGDYYGTGTVDSSDLGVLGTTFGLGLGNPAFIAAFDSDGNGEIDSVDLSAFGTRFGLTI